VESVRAIIAAMRDAVPEGRQHLDERELGRLRELTPALVTASAGADEQHAPFLAIGERAWPCPARICRTGSKAGASWSPGGPDVWARC
jgi:hypothetical protein